MCIPLPRLALIGGYSVSRADGAVPPDAVTSDDTIPSSVDRALTVEASRPEGAYRITTRVIEQEIEVVSALDLLGAVDELVPKLLSELSGRRITFSSISFSITEWHSVRRIPVEGVLIGINSDALARYELPAREALAVYLDGERAADELGRIDRTPTGSHRILIGWKDGRKDDNGTKGEAVHTVVRQEIDRVRRRWWDPPSGTPPRLRAFRFAEGSPPRSQPTLHGERYPNRKASKQGVSHDEERSLHPVGRACGHAGNRGVRDRLRGQPG